MKFGAIVFALALSASSFASTVISGNAQAIRLSFAQVTKVATEFREYSCPSSDSDIETCKWPTAFKKVVQVTVDYSSTGMSESEESIVENFDADLFSEADLKSLSSKNAGVRMNTARKLFDVKVQSEVRTISREVCTSDFVLDCQNGQNTYVDTYKTTVKLVDIVRK